MLQNKFWLKFVQQSKYLLYQNRLNFGKMKVIIGYLANLYGWRLKQPFIFFLLYCKIGMIRTKLLNSKRWMNSIGSAIVYQVKQKPKWSWCPPQVLLPINKLQPSVSHQRLQVGLWYFGYLMYFESLSNCLIWFCNSFAISLAIKIDMDKEGDHKPRIFGFIEIALPSVTREMEYIE